MKLMLPTAKQCQLVTVYEDTIIPFKKFNSGRKDIVFCNSPHDADMIILFEEFSYKTWKYAEILQNDEFIMEFAHKIFVLNYDDYGRGHFPGLYTSLTQHNFLPGFHKACCYPNAYNQYISKDRYVDVQGYSPKWLFSFSGTIKSHAVREKIYSSLSSVPDGKITFIDQMFHTHSIEQKQNYINEILESAFVLCPRGWSPTTYRLFEVMALGRCPVIVSDDWVPIAGIDWDICSIRVKEKDVHRIPEILRAYNSEAEFLGRNALKVWTDNFSVQMRYRGYLDKLLELRQSMHHLNISFQTLFRRWNSYSFYFSNGWTMPQRIFNKARRSIAK